MIENGHEAIHTNDLPEKHLTLDTQIIDYAEKENRIVVTKDSDFYKYHLIKGVPKRLLFVTIGNVVNKELVRLFELNFPKIEQYFASGNNVIEFSNNSITVHS